MPQLKATGLSFNKARSVVERLVREGYARSRPHSGTVVLSRGKNILRGRVLVTYPDIDVCRYYPTQLFDTISRRLCFGRACEGAHSQTAGNCAAVRLRRDLPFLAATSFCGFCGNLSPPSRWSGGIIYSRNAK